MGNARFVTRWAMVTAALIVGFAAPSSLWAKGVLENPQAGSFQSGSYRLPDFPWSGTDVVVRCEESLQNFVIESVEVNVPEVSVGAL